MADPVCLAVPVCVLLIKWYATMSSEHFTCGVLEIQEGFNLSVECVCVCLSVYPKVCSQQLGLCSYGDGCEALWESNLQEVIATGWSICGMRMAPEGLVMDVQLAICCKCCSQGQEAPPLPRNHTGKTAFSNDRARDSIYCPGSSAAHPRHWASDALSGTDWKHPQLERWVWAVHLLVCGMGESDHSMPHSVAQDHYSSSSQAKSSGCSILHQTSSPLLDRGLSIKPEVTNWHSSAGFLLLSGTHPYFYYLAYSVWINI